MKQFKQTIHNCETNSNCKKNREKSTTRFINPKILFPVLIIISVYVMAIGYGAINTSLSIGGSVQANGQSGIYITSVEKTASSNATDEVSYYVSNILNTNVVLSSTSSYVTYTISITNTNSEVYYFKELNTGSYTSSKLDITLEDLAVGQKLEAGGTVTFTVKLSYPDGESVTASELTAYLQFEFANKQYATTSSYEGYYADIDGDEIVDGIIYADLVAGQTNTTGLGYDYSWDKISSTDVKEYTVSDEMYSGVFGDSYILTPAEDTTGEDRFYVMALEDSSTEDYSRFSWYYNAYENEELELITSTDFGTGKTNTETMLKAWTEGTYGEENEQDLWNLIEEDSEWFVPSIGEWAAFLGEMGIEWISYSSSNYSEYGLSNYYWSSSQKEDYISYVYCVLNFDGMMEWWRVNMSTVWVRLSATM